MTQYTESKSGLVIPVSPPEPSQERRYWRLELQDEKDRELAKQALSMLWDAMHLSGPTYAGIRLPGCSSQDTQEAYDQAWHYVGKMLLGKDCPSKEVLT